MSSLVSALEGKEAFGYNFSCENKYCFDLFTYLQKLMYIYIFFFITGQYGIGRPFYFPFLPCYWLNSVAPASGALIHHFTYSLTVHERMYAKTDMSN